MMEKLWKYAIAFLIGFAACFAGMHFLGSDNFYQENEEKLKKSEQAMDSLEKARKARLEVFEDSLRIIEKKYQDALSKAKEAKKSTDAAVAEADAIEMGKSFSNEDDSIALEYLKKRYGFEY